jgi:hypothetical protein
MSSGASLIFADAETGKGLDDGGAWADAGCQFRPRFVSREDAEAFMTAYLEKHPHAECWISCDGDAEGLRVVSPKFEEYYREKTRWTRWRMSSWIRRLLTPDPIGRYFRPLNTEHERAMNEMHGGILCLFGVMSILFGLSLPVIDDLCGPTASQAPGLFWTCVTLPVLFGAFLVIRGYIRFYKAANKSPTQ